MSRVDLEEKRDRTPPEASGGKTSTAPVAGSMDSLTQGKAWGAWIASPAAQRLRSGSAQGEYLENRLWWAFMAGYTAAIDATTKASEVLRDPSNSKESASHE